MYWYATNNIDFIKFLISILEWQARRPVAVFQWKGTTVDLNFSKNNFLIIPFFENPFDEMVGHGLLIMMIYLDLSLSFCWRLENTAKLSKSSRLERSFLSPSATRLPLRASPSPTRETSRWRHLHPPFRYFSKTEWIEKVAIKICCLLYKYPFYTKPTFETQGDLYQSLILEWIG